MKKKKLVDSSTPFTDWVRNGAKEEEWQEFLRDQEKKVSREARKIRDGRPKKLKESGIEWEELFRGVRLKTSVGEIKMATLRNGQKINR